MKEEKKYEGFGEVHTVKEWAGLLKVSQRAIRRGLVMDYGIEEIAEVLEVEPEAVKRRILESHGTFNQQMHPGFGTWMTCPKWAVCLGIPRNTLWRKLKKGLTIEEIAAERGIEYSPKYGRLK